MKTHYFFTLSSEQLEEYKLEYLWTNTKIFGQRYKISNVSIIKLFGKKWWKWSWRIKLVIKANKQDKRDKQEKENKQDKQDKQENMYLDKAVLFQSFNDDYYYNTYIKWVVK